MAGKFSMPRFPQEDLESTQELPQLPADFEPMPEPISNQEPYLPYVPREAYPPEEEYDPEEELPEDFIDTALRVIQNSGYYLHKHWKKIVVVLCALTLMIIMGIVGALTAGSGDPYDEKILNNVMLADVLVGGMTKDQAAAALNASLGSAYATQSMTIDLGEQVIKLDPSQSGAKLNVQAAVDAAYAYGRTGTDAERKQAYQNSLSSNYILAVLPYLELNEDLIRETLAQIETDHVSKLTQPSYALDGEVSSFSTETFNPAASGQSLIITTGTPQVDFDADAVYKMVLDAYSLGQFRVEAQGPTTIQTPNTLDLDAIYQEFYVEAKDSTLDMTDFTPIPGTYGREFDLDAAKQLLSEAGFGETIHIPMTYPAPKGDPTSVLYRDVLGEWITAQPSDENWKHNMKLACTAINGVELNPGDTFAFNAVVGQPTENRGYALTPGCEGADSSDSFGGVCQVASAVYVAALLSDLDVSNRSAHSVPPSYIQKGMDAKVIWGESDLVFRNSGIYPVRIEAEVSGGYLKVKIIGTDTRTYRTDIESSVSETIQPKIIYEEYPYDNSEGYRDGDVIQQGVDGYHVKTYKRKYDKDTDSLISRDFVATSKYPSQDKIVAQVAPPVLETEATDPPSETVDVPSDFDSENFEAVG